MSNFPGEYLRVLTPKTTDGQTLMYDEDMQVQYKESHLPMSALKNIEKENAGIPPHLKHIIEIAGQQSFEAAPMQPKASRPAHATPMPSKKVTA